LKGIEIPAFVIGALTAGGGTFGYIKTGSIPSVVAGVTVGTLVSFRLSYTRLPNANWRLIKAQYMLGGYRIQNRQSYGIEAALLASIILAGSSIPRVRIPPTLVCASLNLGVLERVSKVARYIVDFWQLVLTDSTGAQIPETSSNWIECACFVRSVHIRKCFQTQKVEYGYAFRRRDDMEDCQI
jgi:uncharacterized membrane protein (UPF0136 family)